MYIFYYCNNPYNYATFTGTGLDHKYTLLAYYIYSSS